MYLTFYETCDRLNFGKLNPYINIQLYDICTINYNISRCVFYKDSTRQKCLLNFSRFMLTIQRSNLKCIIKTSNSSSYTGFRPNQANESPRTVFWVCCKNINEQKNIKCLEIPSQLKLNLFRVWKQYQMEREEIKQHRGRVERELPLRRGDYHRLVITYYSYKDRSPRIPGQGDFTTDTDYSYYFH